jgi:hypothetical protein
MARFSRVRFFRAMVVAFEADFVFHFISNGLTYLYMYERESEKQFALFQKIYLAANVHLNNETIPATFFQLHVINPLFLVNLKNWPMIINLCNKKDCNINRRQKC